VKVREQYQIEISNRLEALQILIDSKDINRPWKKIKYQYLSQIKGYVCINGNSIHHAVMMNVHKFQIKGSRLKFSGYRIQTKQTVRTRISETRRGISMTFRKVTSLELIK